MFTWAQRRKLTVSLIFTILVVGVFAYIFYFYVERKTGRDDILFDGKNLSILWSRFFQLRDGFVDVASLVDNPNNLSAQKIIYSFKIYDKNNILIAIKKGETFASPLERFVIFEPNIGINERIPARVVFDIKEVIFSETQGGSNPKVDILGTDEFFEDVFPRISVKIKNREKKSLENVRATIVVFGKDKNASAVSETVIPFLAIDEERIINFTWLKAFGDVFATKLYFR